MIISTIIHGLEIATVLLVGLMSFQITRCYRQYVTGAGSPVEQPAALDQTEYKDSEAKITVAETAVLAREAVEPAVVAPSMPASSAILNDYIGGFFEAEPQADLNAFKVEEAKDSLTAAEPDEDRVTVSKEQLAEFKAPETIEPILVNPVRVVDVDEEDTFIVVEADSVEAPDKKENVMSDKVVHAMLEEANLVYTP